MKLNFFNISLAVSTIAVTSTLTGCFHESTDDSVIVKQYNAVVATRSMDYSSGAHSIIAIDTDTDTYNATNELDSSGSDLHVVTYGENIYRIGKYGLNHITKYSIDSPSTVVWQYSTQDDSETSSNPYDIAFVNESKAYVIRYGSDKVWIINPSATTEENFKTGEIDLSAYADSDGAPEMSQALIIDNKLYILMQRLVNYAPAADVDPYVAVFDTTTDTEIDTTAEDTALKGIALSVKNPSKMQYLNSSNSLLISAIGKYAVTWTDPTQPAEYTGGIETVSLSSYSTNLLLDDGDADNHPYGQIRNIAILNSTRAYFHGYFDGFSDNLYEFNPTTGAVVDTPVLESLQIADIVIGPLGNLWVGDATNHAIKVISTVDNSILGNPIDTVLNPINISFITVETEQEN